MPRPKSKRSGWQVNLHLARATLATLEAMPGDTSKSEKVDALVQAFSALDLLARTTDLFAGYTPEELRQLVVRVLFQAIPIELTECEKCGAYAMLDRDKNEFVCMRNHRVEANHEG